MAYGTKDKSLAESKAEEFRKKYQVYRFEVQGYSWPAESRAIDLVKGTHTHEPLEWGVAQYVPYVPEKGLAWRFDGFLWIF